jgi:hypothetical protein
MSIKPFKIDASNRGDHYYLTAEHECYFFYEFTAGKLAGHSQGNQLVMNLKKSVTKKSQIDYKYKIKAIADSAKLLNGAFLMGASVLSRALVCPIPPSKIPGHAEYDDRMFQIASGACHGTGGECSELITQLESYAAAHHQQDGSRPKPSELEANYKISQQLDRQIVILVDDVLTTGSHFVAARNVILRTYPETRVIGFFMARRALPDPAEEFSAIFD